MDFAKVIFPELGESDDERVRKDIVEAVELHKDFTQVRKEHIYAWLEKQKEQNHWQPCIGELVELGKVIEYIESGKSGYKGGISYLKTLKEDLNKL